MVLSHIRTIPEIILLGNNSQAMKRLAVFSFMVRHPRGTFLHHNFVCAVLNDMFGIQARGGCACAGPYAQDLMGIDEELANHYEAVLHEDRYMSTSKDIRLLKKIDYSCMLSKLFILIELKIINLNGHKGLLAHTSHVLTKIKLD